MSGFTLLPEGCPQVFNWTEPSAESFYMRSSRGSTSRKTGANTRETMAISFSRILSEGPEVSLNGSPTTSPSIAALCASDPLPP